MHSLLDPIQLGKLKETKDRSRLTSAACLFSLRWTFQGICDNKSA
jgi:hypothetical protein